MELREHPFHVFIVGGGADDAAPELRVAMIAISSRDVGLLNHVPVHPLAVDVRVRFLAGRKREPDQHVASVACDIPLGDG
jgi:hypothetical protein